MEPKMLAADLVNLLGITPQAIHNQLKRKQLKFVKSRNRVYFGHDTTKQILNIKFKPQVLAFQIVKGGTGKTTICHSVAVRSALYGARVLCIDLDQQGNLTSAFRFNPNDRPVMIDVIKDGIPFEKCIVNVAEGIDLFPSRIENAMLDSSLMLMREPLDRVYKSLIDSVRDKYDLILIDCPPALGSSVTAIALAVDLIICPVMPGEFEISGLKLTVEEVSHIESKFKKIIPMKVLINGFDSRKSLSHDVMRFLVKDDFYGNRLFKTTVRSNQEFMNVKREGISIFDSLKNNAAKEDIDLLTREILELDEKVGAENHPRFEAQLSA